jgi:magnesium-transporting ATPase (P-type)
MPIELMKEGVELIALEGTNNPFALHTDWRTPTLTFLKEYDERGYCRIIARGAPEELLRICTMVREADDEEGGELPLTEEHLIQFEVNLKFDEIFNLYSLIQQEFLRLSAQSKRCLAVAALDLTNDNFDCFAPSSSSSTEDWRSDLTEGNGEWAFLGLLAFSELPNENCAQKMAEFKAEGIRAILLSEEHPAMVQAMAKLIGMNGRMEGIINGQKEGKVSLKVGR